MAKVLIVANWKMNPATYQEAKSIAEMTKRAAGKNKGVSVIICPPVVYLRELARGSRSALFGIQDLSYEDGGAFTGEISARMAHSAGARYAIIGHSERRHSGETGEVIAKKIAAALLARLTPILCIGENVRDNAGDYLSTVRAQLMEGLSEITSSEIAKVIIAYEPVWAIGKGAADAIVPADLHEMSIYIKKVLAERLDRGKALKASILYGGSVEAENAYAILHHGSVDGFLVGHASLDVKEFPLLINAVA